MFKTKGGGVKGFLNNVKKNCGFGEGGHPLAHHGKELIAELETPSQMDVAL